MCSQPAPWRGLAGVTFNVPSVHERLSLPKRFPFMQHNMAPQWASQVCEPVPECPGL